MQRPLSVFSIEAIFSHMKIEKVWEVRKRNATLRQVINSTDPSKTKKWRVNRLEINGDKIGHDMDDPSCHSLLKGTHVTRWMTCGILIIKDISLEHLQSSLLPVGRTLCKDTVSVEIKCSKAVSSEFVKSFTQLLTFMPLLRALSVHIPNLNESQLCELVDSLSWRNKDFVGEIVFLSFQYKRELRSERKVHGTVHGDDEHSEQSNASHQGSRRGRRTQSPHGGRQFDVYEVPPDGKFEKRPAGDREDGEDGGGGVVRRAAEDSATWILD